MKQNSSNQKTSQHDHPDSNPLPAAGPEGLSIKPPGHAVGNIVPLQRKADPSVGADGQDSPSPNRTGLPDALKAGIESLSGLSMDDVRAHTNSSKPAALQALAYTQGIHIHVAPGQERHLPHEAWHVVQQKQGRVQATRQLKSVHINDDMRLEKEADEMGEKALRVNSRQVIQDRAQQNGQLAPLHTSILSTTSTIQRLTPSQDEILDNFVQKLKISAVEALKALAQSPTMEDFREVVKEMKTKDVDTLMQGSLTPFGLRREVQPYVAWLGEVRNERIASEAEKSEGKFNWVTSGVADSGGKVVPAATGKNKAKARVDNDFTKWIRQLGNKPTDASNMNCWEACLFTAYKAGVLYPWHLVSIYEIAKQAGQVEFDKVDHDDDDIIKAYSEAVASVLGWGEEEWDEGDNAPPRGYLVFFDGPSHVAVSLGKLDSDDDSPAVMSLWDKPGPRPNMQKTSIAKIQEAADKNFTITFGPVPM